MRKRYLILLLAALAAMPAGAQTLAARKGEYAIDPNHAQIIFSLKHLGLSTFYGRIDKITGKLDFDPAAPETAKLDASIDMTGVDAHVDGLTKELREDVFAVKKFPTAHFTATQIAKTSDRTGTVTGDLTLAGVTKPVTLNVVFNGGRSSPIPFEAYRIGFDATGTIKRSDFGLTHMFWSGFISDDVTIAIEAEMERQ